MPVLISFVISVCLSPILIPILRRKKIAQYVREDGPKTHLHKTGTPTMGGIIIVISVVITSWYYVPSNPQLLPVLFLTLSFGVIGFLDDLIKIFSRSSLGLRPWQKIVPQIVVSLIFYYYLEHVMKYGTNTLLPFSEGKTVELGKLFLPMLLVTIVGTANGANFTDGLDGLASSVTLVVAIFFSVVSIWSDSGIFPITAAVTGSLLGFLIFNRYPARVFMGDTGSLALGGFVAGCAYLLRIPLFIMIIGFVYVLEIISVILQVGYYQLSKGRRIFKMAPIHHHFELCGWSESKIVASFSILTALLCMIGFLAL